MHRNVSFITNRRLGLELLEDRRMLAVIYDDALQGTWQNWSWETTVNTSSTAIVQSGTSAISARHDAGWSGLYLGNSVQQSLDANHEVRFQIHGGAGGQQLKAFLVDASDNFVELGDVNPRAGQWTEITLDFQDFQVPPTYGGFVIQEFTGSPANTYYVDQIEIDDFLPDDGSDPQQGPSITVNPNIVLGQISDGVYGLNFADPQLAVDIDLPVNRWGGNSTTRFNYQLDATNLASDFFL